MGGTGIVLGIYTGITKYSKRSAIIYGWIHIPNNIVRRSCEAYIQVGGNLTKYFSLGGFWVVQPIYLNIFIATHCE
jgi:hypothetical protein